MLFVFTKSILIFENHEKVHTHISFNKFWVSFVMRSMPLWASTRVKKNITVKPRLFRAGLVGKT